MEPPFTWFLDKSSACQLALHNSRGWVLQVLLVISKIKHNSPPNSIQGSPNWWQCEILKKDQPEMKHKMDGWDWITDLQCLVLLLVLAVLLFTLFEQYFSVPHRFLQDCQDSWGFLRIPQDSSGFLQDYTIILVILSWRRKFLSSPQESWGLHDIYPSVTDLITL